MIARVGAQHRRLCTLGVMILIAIAMVALFVAPASAAVTTAANPITAIQQLQQGPLLAFTCKDCHATTKDDLLPGVNFSHGAHMAFDCTACHPKFPHTSTGTVVPSMPACFNCHGLHHGPQGLIALADCSVCHQKPRAELLPTDHTAGYAGNPHVLAAKADLNSCWMCHTKDQCDACHVKTNTSWDTTASLVYTTDSGCLACHSHDLPRLIAPVTSSNLASSAHRDLTCAQCHTDYRYDDKVAPTKLWNVNVGLSCGQTGCHVKEQAVWAKSVHGTAVLSGADLSAATCASCHGGHDIELLNTQAAKDKLQLSGATVCAGACHTHDKAVASYADYYHGAAYKQGSTDAPACWTCHGAHDVTAIADPASRTSAANLPKTCGQAGCHSGVTESFADQGRVFIHGLPSSVAANPVVLFRSKIFGGRK